MRPSATKEEIEDVVRKATSLGFSSHLNMGSNKVVIAILGEITEQVPEESFTHLPGVITVAQICTPYKLSSREFKSEDSLVSVDGIEIGGKRVVVMAGPCAVENEEQIMAAAKAVKQAGACILRGGAFKTRTSPFSFSGLGEAGLRLLAEARERFGIPVITEVTDPRDVDLVLRYADILQVGARNMQNFALLTEIGRSKHPVLLKRNFASTVTEWLLAADYLMKGGNNRVILCERGVRNFEDHSRFSLDICSIPVIKRFSHLPIIVDPSHAAGHYLLVPAVAKAAVAAGADGLLIEVHPNPCKALVDGPQSLTPSMLTLLMEDLKSVAEAVGRYI